MNTPIKTRIAAFVTAAFVAFGTIDLIAHYAYPAPAAVLLVAAAR